MVNAKKRQFQIPGVFEITSLWFSSVTVTDYNTGGQKCQSELLLFDNTIINGRMPQKRVTLCGFCGRLMIVLQVVIKKSTGLDAGEKNG